MAVWMMHHDEDSSVEIHSALVGGLVGAGSFSLLGREGRKAQTEADPCAGS